LAKCGVLAKTLKACGKLIEKVHAEVKAPHWQACCLVDAEKRTLANQIKAAVEKVEGLQNDYADEQDRIAQQKLEEEQANRAKLEALARENNLEDALPPAAPPPSPALPIAGSPLRTDGATISVGKEWRSEVTDFTKALKHVKDDAGVRAAISKAIQAKVKATKGNANKPLAGVRMWEANKVSNR
jgi:hypothetical protein